jgi:hypothetical protein
MAANILDCWTEETTDTSDANTVENKITSSSGGWFLLIRIIMKKSHSIQFIAVIAVRNPEEVTHSIRCYDLKFSVFFSNFK